MLIFAVTIPQSVKKLYPLSHPKEVLTSLLIAIAACIGLPTYGAKDKYNMPFYDRWEGLSADVLLHKGSVFQDKGMADSALVCYTIVANKYHEGEESKEYKRWASKAMFGMGYIYMFNFYNYDEAYRYMQQSLELSLAEGFTENLPYIYLNLGNIAMISLQTNGGGSIANDVLPMYKKALRYAKDTQYWEAYVIIMGNILELAYDSSSPKEYTSIVNDYLRMAIQPKTPRYKLVKYDCMALQAYAAGRYDEALRWLDESGKQIDPHSAMERCQMRVFEHKEKIYASMHDYDKAYQALLSAMLLAKQYDAKDAEVEFCLKFSQLCKTMGDTEKAHDWLLDYYQKKDSLMKQGGIGNIDRIRFLNQIGKINQTVMEMAQKRQVEHVALYGLLAVMVSVIGFSIALYRRNRRLLERNHQIYRNNQDIIQREKEAQQQRDAIQRLLDQMSADDNETQKEKRQKYQGSNLTEEEKERLNNHILRIFDNTDEVCSESFSVNRLAELTGSTYKNVSQVINELHQKSFKQTASTYRIREACRRLADKEHYGNLTIEGIALSVGFKSRSSFVQAFKREIGISPSEYQREAYHDVTSREKN